jgi:hypothetical protein
MEISERMKKDNGIFYEEAKSSAPDFKIPGVEKLIENLVASMKITGCHDYDDVLKKCQVWARRAHHHYYVEKDVGGAVDWCNAIMQESAITIICYDNRWVTASVKSYSAGTSVVKP